MCNLTRSQLPKPVPDEQCLLGGLSELSEIWIHEPFLQAENALEAGLESWVLAHVSVQMDSLRDTLRRTSLVYGIYHQKLIYLKNVLPVRGHAEKTRCGRQYRIKLSRRLTLRGDGSGENPKIPKGWVDEADDAAIFRFTQIPLDLS
ncbi:hypothetical protein N7509_001309 [Penicillium cosmopolitanum]|uniref:Uncharacterized protein n=1 Tax=Penicillium cosmopolitanum TaxID=1131564 RepID=A0A9W9WC87_9EURO|nr:uncharacterized protein N7509_001309 [Penicillium cosmopolitanum]KAJ5414682.1 hypothetical protein N7509_001309 [Penicillium cosmopolitanum]